MKRLFCLSALLLSLILLNSAAIACPNHQKAKKDAAKQEQTKNQCPLHKNTPCHCKHDSSDQMKEQKPTEETAPAASETAQ